MALAQRAVTRATLKGLLRAAGKWDAKGWSPAALLAALPAGAAPPPPPPGAPPAKLREVVLATYRAHARAPPATTDALLGAALSILSTANVALAKDAAKGAASKAPRAAAAAAAAAAKAYAVGQVVQHRLYGYRAVVLGADDRCMAGKAWVEATGARRLKGGTAQPFYKVAVHLGDRAGAQIGYVAQENLALLTGGAALPVLHPLVHRYFSSFSAGAYTPAGEADSEGEEAPRAILA